MKGKSLIEDCRNKRKKTERKMNKGQEKNLI